MKLYLSSFRLGDHPDRLVALLPPNARVAVICNSIDTEDPDVRRAKVADEITWLTEVGLHAEELLAKVADLYDHTGVPYLPLRDGQALVINGDDRELV
ncbi:hypothetical protein [Kribbella sp. NBC_00359]|uniref:hypothetical protein n=1 Tax=Kribbella sp. NBC_00359 TaxID=2975966 RepID=UPI002E24F103